MYTAETLLAAVALTPGRFAGRAKLEKAARAGNAMALRDLAGRVGLLPPLGEELPIAEAFVALGESIQAALRRIRARVTAERQARSVLLSHWALRGNIELAVAYWAAATPAQRSEALGRAKARERGPRSRPHDSGMSMAWGEADLAQLAQVLREHYPVASKRAPAPRDPLAERRTGQVVALYREAKKALVERILAGLGPLLRAAHLLQEASKSSTTPEAIRAALRNAYASAGFRGAAHAHEVHTSVVPRGQETARSSNGSTSSSAAGMSRAYCRKQWSVTTSSHVLAASAAILDADVVALNAAEPAGMLYLRTDLRVVQSRGTSLRLEHFGAVRGGWR